LFRHTQPESVGAASTSTSNNYNIHTTYTHTNLILPLPPTIRSRFLLIHLCTPACVGTEPNCSRGFTTPHHQPPETKHKTLRHYDTTLQQQRNWLAVGSLITTTPEQMSTTTVTLTMAQADQAECTCPSCGISLPSPSIALDAQKQIEDLQAQVRLLTQKATAAGKLLSSLSQNSSPSY
jgi:hypothetical protein